MNFPFFRKKHSLADAKVFQGATDWHCHILPGVDDGIRTMQESLQVLAYYEQIGIKDVWLTPHILEDIPNTTQLLRERFGELQREYHGGIGLHLAAENMVDDLFLERLEAGDVLPLGPQADHLLVETSYMQPPLDLYGTLRKIKAKGFVPVLAHPERYAYMSTRDYVTLKEMGCMFQLNVLSLTGNYGTTAMRKAQEMLSRGMYDLCGTDLHSLDHFRLAVSQPKLDGDTITQVSERLQNLCP